MRVVGGSLLRAGWITWRFRPEEPRVVLAIKATLQPVDQEPCRLAPEPRFVTGDEHWDDDVDLSVRYDSDLALTKPVGEAWITGTLHTPQPVGQWPCEVRIGDLRAAFALVGDRYRTENGAVTDPLPFESMPLCWERCFGGAGFAANPVGRGLSAFPDGRTPLPNIEDPSRLVRSPSDRPSPPPLLPVPRSWPERARLMGTYDSNYVRDHWPYFPPDFQWSHYQAARPAMRLRDGFWRGDETIELRGLDPRAPVVQTRLPGIRPRAFLCGRDGSFTEVGTILDTIVVEADGPTVYCIWRGSAVVADERLEHISHLYLVDEALATPAAAERHRAAFEASLAAEVDEETYLGVEPPREVAEPVAPEPPAVVPQPPTQEQVMEGLREAAVAAGAPESVARRLYEARAARARDVEAERSAVAGGVAAMRELGLDAAADLLEGKDETESGEPAAAPEPEPAAAQDLRREVQRRLQHGEPLSGLLLREADLTLLDFSGRDLSNTVLVRCDLRQAMFEGAKLDGAVLDGARVAGASFRRASLRGASLTGVQGEGVDFAEAVLEDAYGSRASLPGASFVSARAERMELTGSQLEGASFVGATLDEADLSRSGLASADFRTASATNLRLQKARAPRANFDQAMLYGLRAAESSLDGASLRWCQATGSTFARASLMGAAFTESELTSASFADARLDDAQLLSVRARGASFARASLARVRMWGADLMGATFEGASMMNADLRNASLFRAELWQADTRSALTDGANLAGTKLA